jgi:argininosuccinate lyase
LPLDELRSINPLFDQDLYTSLTLESVLAIHNVPGGTAPPRVRQAIIDAKHKIEAISEEAHAHP